MARPVMLFILLLTLATQSVYAQHSLRGTATYVESAPMPRYAVFEATLEDRSLADPAAAVVGRTRMAMPASLPIRFAIAYDPAKIVADHRYAVRARIVAEGKLLFETDAATPVFTQGPASVRLLLRRVTAQTRGSESPLRSPLENTSWQLARFEGGDGRTLIPDAGVQYTIEFGQNGALALRVDCNSGRGTWTSSGPSQVQFGPLALTRAQCRPGSLHDQIVKQWAFVRSYVIKDGRLFLSLMADGGIYEFGPLKQIQLPRTVLR